MPITRLRCHRERPGTSPPSRPPAPATALTTWLDDAASTSIAPPRNAAQREKNAARLLRVSRRRRRSKPMANSDKSWSRKPLLSVDDAAVLLGQSRSSIYRAIGRGDLPVPVFTINGRIRIARRSVERLLAGELPLTAREEGVDETGAQSGGLFGVPGA